MPVRLMLSAGFVSAERVCLSQSVSHSACFAGQDGSNMAGESGTADPLTDPPGLDKRHVNVHAAQ